MDRSVQLWGDVPDRVGIAERVLLPTHRSRATAWRTPGSSVHRRRRRRVYCATYTAYDGRRRPQLLDHRRLPHLSGTQLTGRAANKGIALFPRRSTAATWRCRAGTARRSPSRPPTTATSGMTRSAVHAPRAVGADPARQLRIADRDIGRLARAHPRRRPDAPLRDRRDAARPRRPHPRHRPAERSRCSSRGGERDGYVPNVVYTCGALVHGDHLVVPYGSADANVGIATIPLGQLLDRLT